LSFGDLSENSEYDSAKNEQAIIEARIIHVDKMLSNAVILDEASLTTDVIHVGSKVKVLDVEYNEMENYSIVSSTEANPSIGRISDESPIGKALINKKVGDLIEVEVPAGKISLKIVEISK
ncbi:MAG: transcription elongation factor GreA, partial [Oscillospiraceae bacterium]